MSYNKKWNFISGDLNSLKFCSRKNKKIQYVSKNSSKSIIEIVARVTRTSFDPEPSFLHGPDPHDRSYNKPFACRTSSEADSPRVNKVVIEIQGFSIWKYLPDENLCPNLVKAESLGSTTGYEVTPILIGVLISAWIIILIIILVKKIARGICHGEEDGLDAEGLVDITTYTVESAVAD